MDEKSAYKLTHGLISSKEKKHGKIVGFEKKGNAERVSRNILTSYRDICLDGVDSSTLKLCITTYMHTIKFFLLNILN